MASYTKVQSLQSDSLFPKCPAVSGVPPVKATAGVSPFFLAHPFRGSKQWQGGKKGPWLGSGNKMDVAGTKNGLEKWEVRRITKSCNYTLFRFAPSL